MYLRIKRLPIPPGGCQHIPSWVPHSASYDFHIDFASRLHDFTTPVFLTALSHQQDFSVTTHSLESKKRYLALICTKHNDSRFCLRGSGDDVGGQGDQGRHQNQLLPVLAVDGGGRRGRGIVRHREFDHDLPMLPVQGLDLAQHGPGRSQYDQLPPPSPRGEFGTMWCLIQKRFIGTDNLV